MKIVQINSVCGIGSTGRIATGIHDVLIKEGHTSYVAYGRGLPIDCDSTIKIGTNSDVYKHVALTRLTDRHGFGSSEPTQRLINNVEEINPDIIHLHNIHGYFVNVEILFDYLKQSKKPVVWTLHDCWSFTGHCAHFDYIGCEKWKTQCEKCPQKKKYPKSIMLDNSRKNHVIKRKLFTQIPDMTIVTPSLWLEKLVRQSYLKAYNPITINNGIDLNVFKPTGSTFRKDNHIEDKFVILGVANIWGQRKGIEYFYDLASSLEEDESIVIVGLTHKQINNLPDNIIGISRTTNVHELAEVYSTADVFVNPTLEDNFPTTNLEALACGTPVITFDTGGSPEAIDDRSGIVVKKGSYSELRKAINKIKYDKILFDVNYLTSRAKTLFDRETRFKEYIDLYIKLLSEK